jgi:hypothetical protein
MLSKHIDTHYYFFCFTVVFVGVVRAFVPVLFISSPTSAIYPAIFTVVSAVGRYKNCPVFLYRFAS